MPLLSIAHGGYAAFYPSHILCFDKCPGSARNLPFTALMYTTSDILLNTYFRPKEDLYIHTKPAPEGAAYETVIIGAYALKKQSREVSCY
jgi:hypothetical protein